MKRFVKIIAHGVVIEVPVKRTFNYKGHIFVIHRNPLVCTETKTVIYSKKGWVVSEPTSGKHVAYCPLGTMKIAESCAIKTLAKYSHEDIANAIAQ